MLQPTYLLFANQTNHHLLKAAANLSISIYNNFSIQGKMLFLWPFWAHTQTNRQTDEGPLMALWKAYLIVFSTGLYYPWKKSSIKNSLFINLKLNISMWISKSSQVILFHFYVLINIAWLDKDIIFYFVCCRAKTISFILSRRWWKKCFWPTLFL